MKLFRTILSVMTIVTIMVTGCNTIENTTVTNTDSETADSETTDSETTDEKEENKGKDDYKYISEYGEEKLDLDNYSLDYVFETDAQTGFIYSECTKSENGYYVWGKRENNLCFIDSQTLEMVPLCNRPDCSHMDSECNAYYKHGIGEEEFYDKNFIQYYDGYIYIVGTDNEYENLYRVSLDGSTCEKYMSLYRIDLSPEGNDSETVVSYSSPEVWIHRGYVYYLNRKEEYPKIRRMKLGSNEEEIVYETGGERPNVYRMMPHGDYLFFQTRNFTDDTITEIDGGIMAYNINTEKTILIKKGAISSYGIKDKTLYYYKNPDEVISYNLESSEEKTVCRFQMSAEIQLYGDKYIYTHNFSRNSISVYDYDGKLLGSVEDDKLVMCSFGDDKYLLAGYSPSYGVSGTVIISVDDIIAGKGKWKLLEW